MNNHRLTSPKETAFRWCSSFVLPVLIIAALLLLIRFTPTPSVSERPPALHLTYVVLPPKEEKKPEPPKRVKKKVVKKSVQKKPQPKVETVEEVTETDPLADIAVSKSEEKAEPETSTEKETDAPLIVGGESELDNTSFAPLYNPKPAYPVIARKNRITGYVDLDLTINEKGRVIDFKIIKSFGHPTFGKETAKVIPKWRFPPPRLNGKKLTIIYRYRVNFKLN